MIEYKKYLKNILSYSVRKMAYKEKALFDILLGNRKSIVLFGAGQLGQKIARILLRNGYTIKAFSDNNHEKWDTIVENLPVLSPNRAQIMFGNDSTFIVSIWAPRHSFLNTMKQLKELGYKNVIPFIPLMWKYKELLPHYQFCPPTEILRNSHYLLNVLDLFCDEESKFQFISHIEWRLFLSFERLPIPSFNDQYFPKDIIKINTEEFFVDCGAYDGDTIRAFLNISGGSFNKIVGFEPDPINVEKIEKFLCSLEYSIASKIKIYNYAVGSEIKYVKFDVRGSSGSSITQYGLIDIQCIRIDDVLRNDKVTFLKLDVEGFELEALSGATNILKQCRPIIAVAVYHKPNDLWEIPIFLSKILDDYRFYLRTHDEDGLEIILYAIPSYRI